MKGGLDKYWESLCLRCGKCCHEKHFLPDGMLVIDYDSPCPFLKNDECCVYEERFIRCKSCRKVTLATLLFSRTLPPDCGYVRALRRLRVRPLQSLKRLFGRIGPF